MRDYPGAPENMTLEQVQAIARAEALGLFSGPALYDSFEPGGIPGRAVEQRPSARAFNMGPSNITVAVGGFATLSTSCRVDLVLTGRPLRIRVAASGVVAGAGGQLHMSAFLRGREITGSSHGIPGCSWYSSTVGGAPAGEFTVEAPDPGPAAVEVVASAVTAAGTIFSAAGADSVYLSVEEL